MTAIIRAAVRVVPRAAALGALLAGCAATVPPAPLAPTQTAAQYSARRLETLSPALPPPTAGWDNAQWLAAALQLNPQLSEERAEVAAAAAAERTAAEHPNPSMQLFAEYLTSAAQTASWLYGLSLEFLLRQPGERDRARQHAALQTALAQSDLTDSIWQVRAALRLALLDAVAARDESALLESLIAERRALLASDRVRLSLGDIARGQLLADELELSRTEQRAQQARTRAADARARLAAAVGVPVAALEEVPLRWADWAEIGTLDVATPEHWRSEALIGRPQIVHALREYDLAEVSLQGELAKRWPALHITPAYAWGGDGVRQNTLYDIATEGGVAVSFELPILNQHQGPIGEAVARRTAAGEHLKAVQAQIFEQIDRAELAWPAARQAWSDTRRAADIADRQSQAEQRALSAGASERASVVAAQIAATEARLSVLEAAYAAEVAFGALEDAYRRPLHGAESPWPDSSPPHS
ncbi:MAG TPA: TolC family protein [Steroidobacteraceae bacterium]|nr:TolC family protein [Steroidobacteraceae bacterium]